MHQDTKITKADFQIVLKTLEEPKLTILFPFVKKKKGLF